MEPPKSRHTHAPTTRATPPIQIHTRSGLVNALIFILISVVPSSFFSACHHLLRISYMSSDRFEWIATSLVVSLVGGLK